MAENQKTQIMKKYTKEILSTVAALTSLLTLLYIIHTTFSVDVWLTQLATPIMCGIILFVISGLLSVATLSLWKVIQKKGWQTRGSQINLIVIFATFYFCLPMVINHLAWQKAPRTELEVEKRIRQATPQEIHAGLAYLRLNQEVDMDKFLKETEPLLAIPNWVFAAEDPTLYQIGGIRGLPGDETEKWKYELPLGSTFTNIRALIKEAGIDMAKNQNTQAIQKIRVVLGVGNRMAEQPQFMSCYTGIAFLKEGVAFLGKYPSLASDPQIRAEMSRARNMPEVVKQAEVNGFAYIDRHLEEVARNEKGLKVGSFVIPPESMSKVSKRIQDELGTRDTYKIIRDEEIRSYLQGQIFLADIIDSLFPKMNTLFEDSKSLESDIKRLLASTNYPT